MTHHELSPGGLAQQARRRIVIGYGPDFGITRITGVNVPCSLLNADQSILIYPAANHDL